MSEQVITTEAETFEKVLRSAMRLPTVKINRESFLRKELFKHFDLSVVRKAVETNPAQAGISINELEKIAKSCIDFETTKVTTISAVAGIPGGFAMVGTVPADMAQFFGHVIRILQKLVYLYGWQEIFKAGDDEFDDETSAQLTLFIGVMFGVNAANAAISEIANAAAVKKQRTLAPKELTKGTIFPIVKKIAKMIGIEMTKDIFARSIGKTIPVIGAIVSGGVTYAGFKPMAKRLQKYLSTLPMASPDFYKNLQYSDDEVIDIDFSDIAVEDMECLDEADNS